MSKKGRSIESATSLIGEQTIVSRFNSVLYAYMAHEKTRAVLCGCPKCHANSRDITDWVLNIGDWRQDQKKSATSSTKSETPKLVVKPLTTIESTDASEESDQDIKPETPTNTQTEDDKPKRSNYRIKYKGEWLGIPPEKGQGKNKKSDSKKKGVSDDDYYYEDGDNGGDPVSI